jgi:hypothetical protein
LLLIGRENVSGMRLVQIWPQKRDRCAQIVSLTKKLRSARKGDRNYFDRQIAAFQDWRAAIDSIANAAARSEH